MTIGVIGEALIDLVSQSDETLLPLVGGSPFNVARALGRQGASCHYLSPLSTDRFGELVLKTLEEDNVVVQPQNRSTKPSSLAVVSFNTNGQPQYSLYREGVADRDYNLLNPLSGDIQALHTGSLALVPNDAPRIRSILESACNQGKLVSIDINMRPSAVENLPAYLSAVNGILPLCDLVKASDEDLEILGLSGSPTEICTELRRRANAALAIVTLGADGAIACTESTQVNQKSLPVKYVKDTVGAGDCFMAGILSSLNTFGYLSPEGLANITHSDLVIAMRHASATASLNLMSKGCQPPFAKQVEQYLDDIYCV